MGQDDLDDLDAQIAALQAVRANKLAKAEAARKAEEKKAQQVLIGATPTKDKAKFPGADVAPPPKRPVFASKTKQVKQVLPSIPQAGPSRLSSSLAALRQKAESNSDEQLRSCLSSVKGKGRTVSAELEVDTDDRHGRGGGKQGKRDAEDLTVQHELRLGPKEHGLDPEGENEWSFLEPNSGIRLSKRVMSHAAVQDHLYGRYYLTPTLLYSVIRLSRDGATYDIPVEGDWLTIAVVAERGEVKISGTKQSTSRDDDDDEEDDEDSGPSGSIEKPNMPPLRKGKEWESNKAKKGKQQQRKRPPRKYINLKLCSLPPRTKGSSSTSGDAMLQLLLFEADSVAHDEAINEDGEKVNIRRYAGGSGGAYEKWCNLAVGSVVAIMNPKVLRPLRAGSQAPHPLTLPLALNPTSGESITLIGQAKDLGRCTAQQKDGNRCRTWVDLRENSVCEYHVHAAVQKGKSGRAEFTASTSSFALTTRSRPGGNGKPGGPGFDLRKKTGLLPANGAAPAPRGQDDGGGGATYVIGGGIVNTHRTAGGLRGLGDEHLSEKLGRRRAEKRKKRDEERETEEALKKLMERDGAAQSTGGKYLASIGVDVGKKAKKANEDEQSRKRAFSAQAIKRIGFDPTLQVGAQRSEDKSKRAESINMLKNPDKTFKLGKPAGMGFSSVKAPALDVPSRQADEKGDLSGEGEMIDLD